jgi:hypothetical protein
MNARSDGWVGQGETTPSITTKRWHVVDVMVHQTTNDDEAEMDNCGAVECEVVEAEKNDGFSILLINTSIWDIKKRNTCRASGGRRSKARFGKKWRNAFPGFPLRAVSHADIICCAFTEICTVCT